MTGPQNPQSRGGRFGVFVRGHLEADAVHRVRGSILESAARLEFSINEVLGARLASSIETSDELAVNVLTRIPVRDRIAMLDRHMKETAADELWPLLVPVLRRIYDLRNRYAHGWMESAKDWWHPDRDVEPRQEFRYRVRPRPSDVAGLRGGNRGGSTWLACGPLGSRRPRLAW